MKIKILCIFLLLLGGGAFYLLFKSKHYSGISNLEKVGVECDKTKKNQLGEPGFYTDCFWYGPSLTTREATTTLQDTGWILASAEPAYWLSDNWMIYRYSKTVSNKTYLLEVNDRNTRTTQKVGKDKAVAAQLKVEDSGDTLWLRMTTK